MGKLSKQELHSRRYPTGHQTQEKVLKLPFITHQGNAKENQNSIPTRMAKLKKKIQKSAGKDTRTIKAFIHCLWECKLVSTKAEHMPIL